MTEGVQPGQATRLPPFPKGWCAVGFSEEFPRGAVETRELGGRELLVFRTEGGAISAMDRCARTSGLTWGMAGRWRGSR